MSSSMPPPPTLPPSLPLVDASKHAFAIPAKRIHTQQDATNFLCSQACHTIMDFILHLNASVTPFDAATNTLRNPDNFATNSPSVHVSPEVQGVVSLIRDLESLIEAAPPDSGPRRFGNVAFRKWHALVEDKVCSGLLDKHLPARVLVQSVSGTSAKDELVPYLLGSFGSAQRLDYGTGHELSFAAFLCTIWVLGGFTSGRDELGLVLRAFDAYFHLIRKLVLTYTLEPAGSHGVWGLDDHFFLPYIFGSAQLTTFPPTNSPTDEQNEAFKKLSQFDIPKPGDVTKSAVVEKERERNLYFGAIGFIYDVKKGPFWEHSPILYDISGVQGGWGKINKGMVKMYKAEVLGKFPVVQHFPFGSIFEWVPFNTPENRPLPALQENSTEPFLGASPVTVAPWVKASQPNAATTRAPWTQAHASPTSSARAMEQTKAPWSSAASIMTSKPEEEPLVGKAPWAVPQPPPFPISAGVSKSFPPPAVQPEAMDAKTPWASSSSSSPRKSEDIPLTPQATEANLGPIRTSSPDSKLATSESEEADRRRGSMGTGGVRVAETGDLKRKSSNAGSGGRNSIVLPEVMTRAP
ncbi:Serine/threonine-protein phosphatase 2A activator 1 [Rhizina undulata]